MNAVSPAREISFRILLKVEQGGYASDLLRRETGTLDARNAALAESIVMGVLRYQAQLDSLIALLSGREVRKIDAEVLIALRMGIFQIRHLDRVPAHAAVGESVELVKLARKKSAAGFANAVLRRIHRDPVEWPDRATELSIPPWMLERWEKRYGMEQAQGIARAALEEPGTYINEATGRQQDIGAQSIVPLLGIEPGMKVLDLCAAPGNKTAQMLAQLEGSGLAVAGDRYLRRLEEVPRESARVVLDATEPLPFGAGGFDRILVDAPCSGTGTLARNPEIKWRLKPGDLEGFAERQVRILEEALKCLAPGGRLVYSTCTLEPEENENVVERVRVQRPSLKIESHWRIPGREPGDGFFAAVVTP